MEKSAYGNKRWLTALQNAEVLNSKAPKCHKRCHNRSKNISIA